MSQLVRDLTTAFTKNKPIKLPALTGYELKSLLKALHDAKASN
jgi:hypothetical protein